MSQEWQFATKTHIPVMPKEVLSYLNVQKNGVYVDGTIGLGGHSQLILSRLSAKGHLVGVDRDAEALEICKKRLSNYRSSLSLFNKSYDKINSILDSLEIQKVNGILLDLGLSSFQLDNKDRGFSYKTNCELDMRFDRSQKISALNIVNNMPEKMLADLIYYNSEEKRSRAIARKIISMRPINKVFDLVEAIKKSTPPFKRDKTISRVFQAVRISVNNELEKLDQFLSTFYPRLLNGGRIVIISFHSLEDRKVKHAFKLLKSENNIQILTKKPLMPTEIEKVDNSRSRSAKLRAAERKNDG